MRYVVFGSMPATMKLVLSPGTMGMRGGTAPGQGGALLGELDVHRRARGGGRAVQGDQGVGHGGNHRAVPDDPRLRVYVAVADSPVEAAKLFLTITWML